MLRTLTNSSSSIFGFDLVSHSDDIGCIFQVLQGPRIVHRNLSCQMKEIEGAPVYHNQHTK